MPKTIEAIYEDGVLKPLQKIAVKEHQRVRLILTESLEEFREYTTDQLEEFIKEDRLDKETALKVQRLLRKKG